MRSITEATFKDAAIIEVRSLLARLEDVAGRCAANPQAMLTAPVKQETLESVTRQAARLADIIERIDEAKPKPKRRRGRGRQRRTTRPALVDGYPADWPRCHCGRPALDGHVTCGAAACDEGGTREARRS